jgi:hypothetical protein
MRIASTVETILILDVLYSGGPFYVEYEGTTF